jgi:hypothetical protein
MIERSRLVEVGRRSDVCQICTCAKSAQLRARADQKCVKPGFILLEKISEVGIGSKRATSALAKFAAPKSGCNTPFIKCACQICT